MDYLRSSGCVDRHSCRACSGDYWKEKPVSGFLAFLFGVAALIGFWMWVRKRNREKDIEYHGPIEDRIMHLEQRIHAVLEDEVLSFLVTGKTKLVGREILFTAKEVLESQKSRMLTKFATKGMMWEDSRFIPPHMIKEFTIDEVVIVQAGDESTFEPYEF